MLNVCVTWKRAFGVSGSVTIRFASFPVYHDNGQLRSFASLRSSRDATEITRIKIVLPPPPPRARCVITSVF